jgi:hypothetical protein
MRRKKKMRIAKQITYPNTQHTQVEDVPLIKGETIMEEANKPVAVEQPQRSPQQVLDSIVGMLFNQHKQQIYKYMLELEKQIVLEEQSKLDITKKTE